MAKVTVLSDTTLFTVIESAAVLPRRSSGKAAGYDLYALEDGIVRVGVVTKFRTGIMATVPDGYAGLIMDRSSMGSKGVMRLAGVIDSDYNNVGKEQPCSDFEVGVLLTAIDDAITVRAGDRIAQLLLVKLFDDAGGEVADVRVGGFGSTGV